MFKDIFKDTSINIDLKYALTFLFLVNVFIAMLVMKPQWFGNPSRDDMDALKRQYDSAQTYWQARKDSVVVLQKRIDTVIANKTVYINTITRERQERVAYIKVMSADSLVLVFRKELDSARNK